MKGTIYCAIQFGELILRLIFIAPILFVRWLTRKLPNTFACLKGIIGISLGIPIVILIGPFVLLYRIVRK